MADLPFACKCGKVTGKVRDTDRAGLRIECFCDSCRAAANICDPARDVDAPVPLFLSYPDKYDVSGADLLEPFAFGPKNITRWRTTCCGTRLFSTQPNAKLAFASLAMEQADPNVNVGPVRSRAFVPQPDGKTKHENGLAMVGLILGVLVRRITGKWRQTPFFDTANLTPIAPVKLYSKAEKHAALARPG